MLFAPEPCHWLDCNIFVQAKNGPFRFKTAPGFWRWLEKANNDGLVSSSIYVYNEIQKGKDELAEWARRMKPRGLFVTPDRSVQEKFGEIAAFVQSRYAVPQSALFLAGADPWVIAHAYAERGTVVTHEVFVPDDSMKIKIPNVCAHFGVQYIGAYDAFSQLGMKL